MNWRQLLEETLGAVSVYAFLGMLTRRVSTGIGSEAEMKLVEFMRKVVLEYKDMGLTEEKRIEQAEITASQREFDRKWGLQESGNVLGHIIKQ